MMLTACPLCESRSLKAFSFTVEGERNRAMHFAQSRCRSCDLVFSNPMADDVERERYYRASYLRGS